MDESNNSKNILIPVCNRTTRITKLDFQYPKKLDQKKRQCRKPFCSRWKKEISTRNLLLLIYLSAILFFFFVVELYFQNK